jgi:hypothetical protein
VIPHHIHFIFLSKDTLLYVYNNTILLPSKTMDVTVNQIDELSLEKAVARLETKAKQRKTGVPTICTTDLSDTGSEMDRLRVEAKREEVKMLKGANSLITKVSTAIEEIKKQEPKQVVPLMHFQKPSRSDPMFFASAPRRRAQNLRTVFKNNAAKPEIYNAATTACLNTVAFITRTTHLFTHAEFLLSNLNVAPCGRLAGTSHIESLRAQCVNLIGRIDDTVAGAPVNGNFRDNLIRFASEMEILSEDVDSLVRFINEL